MARKRKRRRRFPILPLLVAAALLAAVVFAVIPRAPRRHAHRIAQSSPLPISPAAEATPLPAPSESPAVAPSPSPPRPSPSPTFAANAPRVAIIIDDCGQWPRIERGYLALPIPLTLAVLPHVAYTAEIARDAAAAGKGVMLHLPMEPLSHINPGPGEISTSMTDAQVTQQTEDDVAQIPGVEGINNHEGSAASADARVMRDVIAVAKEHDLFFIDSRTSAKTVAAQTAQAAGVPSASRDVFLDNQADVAYTESMLERAIAVARRKGSAIAIGHPRPTTLEALTDMYPKMQSEGVQFVLASSLVK